MTPWEVWSWWLLLVGMYGTTAILVAGTVNFYYYWKGEHDKWKK